MSSDWEKENWPTIIIEEKNFVVTHGNLVDGLEDIQAVIF